MPSATSFVRKVGKQLTRHMMVKPLSERLRKTGPVPLSAAKCYPTPNSLDSWQRGMGTPPGVSPPPPPPGRLP